MVRLLLALATASIGFAAGCYSERLPPPAYRYSCDADSDCSEPERCVRGVCQVPCTAATFDNDCGDTDFIACLNGVCTGLCQMNDGCGGVLQCIESPIDLGDNVDPGTGVCAEPCTSDNGVCPTGESCLEGWCVATCSEGDPPCALGTVCVAGFCVTETVADDTGASSPTDDSDDAGETTPNNEDSGASEGGTQ